MALLTKTYQLNTWTAYETGITFQVVATTDQPGQITYKIELISDPTKFATFTGNSGVNVSLSLTPAETELWIGSQSDNTEFINDEIKLTITDGVETYVTNGGTIPHLTFAYLPFYNARPTTVVGSPVVVNEIEILNLTWTNLYDNGDIYNLWRYNGTSWLKMSYSGHIIKFSNLKNIHFKYTDCFGSISTPSVGNKFRITKDGVDYDVTNGYHLDFNYVTFIPLAADGNLVFTEGTSGYKDEGRPSGRYYIGDRVGGEKAIYIDEFMTLGQLEFDGNIRARVRDIAGRLPNIDGTIPADAPLDLARAFNIRIETNPVSESAQYVKQINFETCEAVTSYSYESWKWGVWHYYDLEVLEITGADADLIQVWGTNPFLDGRYDCTYKSISSTTNHDQPSTTYTLYFEPRNSGATLRFFSLVKKGIASLPESGTLSDNIFNIVITKVI